MKTLKKIGTMVVIGLLAATALVGCTQKITMDDHNQIVKELTDKQMNLNEQINVLQEKVTQGEMVQADLEVLQSKLAEQEARDAQILADYEELKKQIDAEEEVIEAEAQIVSYTMDDWPLNAFLMDTKLNNNDLVFLQDGEIEFAEKDYDIQEKIVLKDLTIGTSLYFDDEFKDLPALLFESESTIQYRYIFDDIINYTEVSEDEPLKISMLDKEYTIIEMNTNFFTIVEGTKKVLREGESVVIDGKKIELGLVASNDKIEIIVDGETDFIEEGFSESVNGLDIRVDKVLYTGKDTQKSVVELTISNDKAEKTIDNGDEYIEDNDKFKWVIGTDFIGIDYVEKANDADEDILYPGDSLSFAGLFDVSFDYETNYDYAEFEVSFDTATSADIDCALFKSLDGKNLIIGDEELEQAWFDGSTNTIWYKDDHNDWTNMTGKTLYLENNDVSYNVTYINGTLKIGPMEMPTSAFTYFGGTAEEAELTDLDAEGKFIGTRDSDVLLTDGTIISAPENDLEDDELLFKIPDEVVEMELTVSK